MCHKEIYVFLILGGKQEWLVTATVLLSQLLITFSSIVDLEGKNIIRSYLKIPERNWKLFISLITVMGLGIL